MKKFGKILGGIILGIVLILLAAVAIQRWNTVRIR